MLHISPMPTFVGLAQATMPPAQAANVMRTFLGELKEWTTQFSKDRWVATTAMTIDDPAIADLVAWQISETRLAQVNQARDEMIRILQQTTGLDFVQAAQRGMYPDVPASFGDLIRQTQALLDFWKTHQEKAGISWMSILAVTAIGGAVVGTAWWSAKYWKPYFHQFKVARCARKCKGRRQTSFRACQSRCMRGLRLSP